MIPNPKRSRGGCPAPKIVQGNEYNQFSGSAHENGRKRLQKTLTLVINIIK